MRAEDKIAIKATVKEALSPFESASDDKIRKAYSDFPQHVREVLQLLSVKLCLVSFELIKCASMQQERLTLTMALSDGTACWVLRGLARTLIIVVQEIDAKLGTKKSPFNLWGLLQRILPVSEDIVEFVRYGFCSGLLCLHNT